MFRIKTDIREYRCDSRAKAERLIRNWVIRPTDLIYDVEAEGWLPIGDDPEFVELFASLDEAHEAQPATVVTEQAAENAAADREELMTNGEISLEEGSDPRPAQGVEVEEEPVKPLKPPVPSDDVEGLIRDSDEITMMTEQTLEMLTMGDVTVTSPSTSPELMRVLPASVPPTSPVVPPGEATAGPDEPTSLIERPDFEDDDEVEPDRRSDGEDRPSSTVIIDDDEHGSEDIEEAQQPGEEQQETSADAEEEAQESLRETEDSPISEELPAPPISEELPAPPASTGGTKPRKRHHDLPEDVFVTADLGADDLSADRLDDLSSIDAGHDDHAVMGSDNESRSNWNIVLDDMTSAEAGKKKAPVDPLGETAEFALEELSKPSQGDTDQDEEDGAIDALRETDELGIVDRDELAPADDDEALQADPDDDELPEAPEFDETIDETFEELEESAIAARAAEDDGELEEIPLDEVIPLRDPNAPSMGYEVDFLIPIKPSDHLVRLGIQQGKASKAKQDHLYSLPRPKKSGELILRTFELDGTSSSGSTATALTLVLLILMALMAGVVVVLALLVLLL